MKKVFIICISTSFTTSFLLVHFKDIILRICLNNIADVDIIYLIALALPLITISSAIAGYFAAVRRIYKNAIGQLLEHLSKVIATIFLLKIVYINSPSKSIFALILGDLFSEIVNFIYISIIYKNDLSNHFGYSTLTNNKTDNTNYYLSILRITIPISITSYIRSGISTFKQLIIPRSLEKSGFNLELSLSKYGIITGMALPIIMFPDIIVRSFSMLLVPEFSRYHSKKDYSKSTKISRFLLFTTLTLACLFSCLLFAFSGQIAAFIYKDQSVSIYIKLLAPLAIFIYTDTVVDSILKGLDKQVGVMIINIIDLIVNTLFIYYLVPILGVKGYIISIYISEILNFSFSLFQLILIMKKTK